MTTENKSNMSESKKTSYSKTIEKDGKRKSIKVDEVENGYIVTIDIYDGEEYSTKKYISVENPMEKDDVTV